MAGKRREGWRKGAGKEGEVVVMLVMEKEEKKKEEEEVVVGEEVLLVMVYTVIECSGVSPLDVNLFP